MLEESEDHQDRIGNRNEFYDNEFYTAIMDEDLGRIEDMSKKYGSNFLIKMQGSTARDFYWKGLDILPLHLAASHRRVKSMQSLLSAGADPEMRDQLGRTPLHLVIAGWPSILTTWLKPGSKVQTATTSTHSKAEACLRLLCEHGANVNAEVGGESHQTALHLSVRYMAVSAVRVLASYGANVNAVNSSGMTPLHMAASILNKDITTSLIEWGADVNMGVTQSGNTPLHLAAMSMDLRPNVLDDGMSCITELLEQGAEANIVNKGGMTPLQEACSMGNKELVDQLLRYGANINKLNKAGENCLFLFLDHRTNVRNSSLLEKLFCLTSPLTVYNHKGQLPSTLTQPWFFKQRDQILKLIQEPRRLQDICKIVIYLKHIQGKQEELRKILPERFYDFVFNYWENLHISFETNSERDSYNNLLDIDPI